MKELVVLSGKGGTGKTSVSGALAHLFSNAALLSDCDVDASNLHLVSGADNTVSKDFYSGLMAAVIPEKCTACGKCASVCRFDSFEVVNSKYWVDPLHCEGCGYCAEVCPENAITLNVNHTGYLKISDTRFNSKLVHASLNIGAENSGKLVSYVREEAAKLAETLKPDIIISDGSPGVGCPVIASITGASYILVVTEPGMSARHDLERLIKLADKFKIPIACVVNKSDIDLTQTQLIKTFLAENNIPFWGELPYSESFRHAVENFKAVTELDNQKVNSAFNEIVSFIKKTLL